MYCFNYYNIYDVIYFIISYASYKFFLLLIFYLRSKFNNSLSLKYYVQDYNVLMTLKMIIFIILKEPSNFMSFVKI